MSRTFQRPSCGVAGAPRFNDTRTTERWWAKDLIKFPSRAQQFGYTWAYGPKSSKGQAACLFRRPDDSHEDCTLHKQRVPYGAFFGVHHT